MGNKIRKLLKRNKLIVKNIKPVRNYKSEDLRIFESLNYISLTYFDNNSIVQFSYKIYTCKSFLYSEKDFRKAEKTIEEFYKKYNIKLKGLSLIERSLKSRGLIIS